MALSSTDLALLHGVSETLAELVQHNAEYPDCNCNHHKIAADVLAVVKREGVCEWKLSPAGIFANTGCGKKEIEYNADFKFCPYCGRKIKEAGNE